jgi:hypothetical protein
MTHLDRATRLSIILATTLGALFWAALFARLAE